eukprot:356258-Chlamydomonas_euryale.AAC.3
MNLPYEPAAGTCPSDLSHCRVPTALQAAALQARPSDLPLRPRAREGHTAHSCAAPPLAGTLPKTMLCLALAVAAVTCAQPRLPEDRSVDRQMKWTDRRTNRRTDGQTYGSLASCTSLRGFW